MPRHVRFSLTVGALAAVAVWCFYRSNPRNWSDFDQLWLAGRALVAGQNPYLTVPLSFHWPLYYPLPAVLVTFPLVAFPLPLARAVFGGVTLALATWVLHRYRPHAMWLLVSGPFLYTLDRGQWSPVILAACFLPALGAVVAVKPTVGLGAWFYQPSRVALVGASILTLASLLVLPRWPRDWFAALHMVRHFRSPVFLKWGFVLLLAALKWRRPEARLFLVLVTVPQTIVPYELVPLALVPATKRQALVVALSWTIAYLLRVASKPTPLLTYADVGPHYMPAHWVGELIFGYLPILVLILRRPNSGERPADSIASAPPSAYR